MNLTKRQKNNKGRTLGILLGLAVAAVAGFVYIPTFLDSTNVDGADSSNELNRVADAQVLPALELVKTDSYQRKVIHTGLVQTRSNTMVAFQRAGLVKELFFDEGQRVGPKQVIARLDTRHLNSSMESLKARLQQAQFVLAELREGPRKQSIDAAQDLVADLQQQLKAQKLRSDRSASLLTSKSIARQDYEKELFAMRALEARLSAARNQLAELKEGTRSERISAQESLIKSIEADQQSLQYNLDDCQLTAPFAGMIVKRYIDAGTVVSAGTPVFELIDDRNLEIHVGVPHALVGQLQPGATYPVNTGQHELMAKLRVILPRVDASTRTCRAIMDVIPDPDSPVELMAGQLAKVELVQVIQEAGFWVPRLALTADHSGLWSCYIVDADSDELNGVAAKQTVEVLHQRDEWVFVRGTIQSGQKLVVEGMHRVVPGQLIAIDLKATAQQTTGMNSSPLNSGFATPGNGQ